MSRNGKQSFNFRGFVALADIFFALSASLLLLNPPTLSNSGDNKGLLEERPLGEVTPILIMLVKNRIVTMNKDNFVFRTEGQNMVWERVKDGESLADGIKRGGLLDNIMMNSDPKKSYFLLYVCSDSIGAFRSVLDLISDRHWPFQWRTTIDTPLFSPVSGTGQTAPPIGFIP
jgi:hypothetical protein